MPRILNGMVAVSIAAVVLGAPALAEQPVRVRVDYTYTARTPSGQTRTVDWTVGAELRGGNKVVDLVQGRSPGTMNITRDESLGQGRWKVAGKDSLVRVADWPNSQTIVRVYVTGQSCQATIESRLKPGKTTHLVRSRADGQYFEMGTPTYSNIRCSIG